MPQGGLTKLFVELLWPAWAGAAPMSEMPAAEAATTALAMSLFT